METDGIVLLVGSGAHRYREYLVSDAASATALWLLNEAEPTWQHRYVLGHTVVELSGWDEVIRAAEEVAHHHRVIGVLTYDEFHVVAAARIAAALGLPGLGVEGAESCRDKHRTRRRLTAAGLGQPRFAYARTQAEADAAATEIGYPVVVKPRGVGGSIGVVRADDPAGLAKAFQRAIEASRVGEQRYGGGALVEEMLTGHEISVDGAVQEGTYHPFFLAHKRLGPAPYFEEHGHVVEADDPLLSDPQLAGMLAKAHRALGLRDGVTHTEVRLTAAGPIIVEVNGRLGGDLIPYLGLRATGIHPGRVAVAVATGARPDLTPKRRLAAGIRFSYPPRDGTVSRVLVPGVKDVPGLRETIRLAVPGTVLRLPPRGYGSRYAAVICEGTDRVGCDGALDAASVRTDVLLEAQGDDPPPDTLGESRNEGHFVGTEPGHA